MRGFGQPDLDHATASACDEGAIWADIEARVTVFTPEELARLPSLVATMVSDVGRPRFGKGASSRSLVPVCRWKSPGQVCC